MSDWVPSHVSLRDHPKRKKLSRKLGMRPWETVGMLHCLWWWTLEYAPDGDLAIFDSTEIADGIDWPGDPDELVGALMHAGFLDADMQVHDWDDNGGKLHRKRQADAERKRAARDIPNHTDAPTTDIQRTSNGHPTDVAGRGDRGEESRGEGVEAALRALPGYVSRDDDDVWLAEVRRDFPKVPIVQEIHACRDWWAAKPNRTKVIWRSRLRSWFTKYRPSLNGDGASALTADDELTRMGA